MSETFQLEDIQAALVEAGVDGWLFYDFRGSDPIARRILGLPATRTGTRRWFYFIPASGQPQMLVHAIEQRILEILPGQETVYLSWQSLESGLADILKGQKRVAMQYSPQNHVPYIARVDAGTIELVQGTGVEVVTSADLVQRFDAVLSAEQLESHRLAAKRLRGFVDDVFDEVERRLHADDALTERQLLDFLMGKLDAAGLVLDHAPIVAVDANAADPHFEVPPSGSAAIQPGSLLLVDVWGKESRPGSINADMTWCAFIGGKVPKEVARVFDVVRRARDGVIERCRKAFTAGDEIKGFELDRIARGIIADEGYGEAFIHRTGHSLHAEVHGNGANLDDLETHDTRRILPRTLFTVEPGIYLPGRFGIRSEVNVFHTGSGAEVTGQPIQEQLIRIE